MYKKKEFNKLQSKYSKYQDTGSVGLMMNICHKGLESDIKNLKFNKKYPDGTMRKILDSSLIKSLGWMPSIDITRGLSETIDWYKKNY